VYVFAIAAHRKLHDTVGQCEERVIFPKPDVFARTNTRAALTHQDVARDDELAAETLDAEALRVGVAAVPSGAGTLLGGEELEIEKEHGRSTIAHGGLGRQDGGPFAKGPRGKPL
jgi:hypothetical protein